MAEAENAIAAASGEPKAESQHLFAPFSLRGLRLANRIVVSPMTQFSCREGVAGDWHLVHLGRYALGGAGLVFVEQAAVQRIGRVTHGCLGLWDDAQVPPLARIASFLKDNGAAAALQLGHAGRKASRELPWRGYGPLGPGRDSEPAWQAVGPTQAPVGEGWPAPRALTRADIGGIIDSYAAAARRADAAGFDALGIHAAHGYLIHSFLSPLGNARTDAYGGDRPGRMRLALEVAEAVRAHWPEHKPLFYRLSVVDAEEGGWEIEDSIALALELRRRGVDVIDCSSGGITVPASGNMTPRSMMISQIRYAGLMRSAVARAGLAVMAVGQITEPEQADAIIRRGKADLVAVGRELLFNPNWPLHAAVALRVDPDYELWPPQFGSWLRRRVLLDLSERT